MQWTFYDFTWIKAHPRLFGNTFACDIVWRVAFTFIVYTQTPAKTSSERFELSALTITTEVCIWMQEIIWNDSIWIYFFFRFETTNWTICHTSGFNIGNSSTIYWSTRCIVGNQVIIVFAPLRIFLSFSIINRFSTLIVHADSYLTFHTHND